MLFVVFLKVDTGYLPESLILTCSYSPGPGLSIILSNILVPPLLPNKENLRASDPKGFW